MYMKSDLAGLGLRSRQTSRKLRSLVYWTKLSELETPPALPDMSNSKKDTLKLERMQSKVMSRRCEDQYRKHERKEKNRFL